MQGQTITSRFKCKTDRKAFFFYKKKQRNAPSIQTRLQGPSFYNSIQMQDRQEYFMFIEVLRQKNEACVVEPLHLDTNARPMRFSFEMPRQRK